MRVHIDFTGPVEGKMWLIIIDAYPMVRNCPNVRTVNALREVFSRLGYPKLILSNNGH